MGLIHRMMGGYENLLQLPRRNIRRKDNTLENYIIILKCSVQYDLNSLYVQ
jgi:hypothetical protein